MKLTITRESNNMWMLRDFEIFIDGEKKDVISNDETKVLELPDNSKILTVRISSHQSKPEMIFDVVEGEYIISINKNSIFITFVTGFIVMLYFVIRKELEIEIPKIYYLFALPLLLLNIYYFTFGKSKNLKIIKKN
jgi:hypothetical protein